MNAIKINNHIIFPDLITSITEHEVGDVDFGGITINYMVGNGLYLYLGYHNKEENLKNAINFILENKGVLTPFDEIKTISFE